MAGIRNCQNMTEGKNETEYAEDALIASVELQPDDVRDFVERRAMNPSLFGDVIVWSFNNHVLDEKQLESQVDDLKSDEYVIPYQVSGIWGYMMLLLPEEIREAEILTYRRSEGRYHPYPNYYHYSEEVEDDETRDRIRKVTREILDRD